LLPSSRATATGRAPIVMAVLGPDVHDGVPLVQAASAAGVPRSGGWRPISPGGRPGCVELVERTSTRHRLPDELLKVIEGMAFRRPPPHAAEVHRAAVKIATEQGWKTPSYTVVGEVTVGLDRGLLALAHHDASVYRDT